MGPEGKAVEAGMGVVHCDAEAYHWVLGDQILVEGEVRAWLVAEDLVVMEALGRRNSRLADTFLAHQ